MDIVIISNFCDSFSESDNDRFLYLANALATDNDVEIITSDFMHTSKSHRTKALAFWPFKITFIHEPGYSKNICLKRFYSHRVWGKNVGKYLKQRKKPDVIYCAIPSLTGPFEAANYCERTGTRFVIDVQDLWPEAFQMVFNIPVVSDVIFAPFKWIVNGIYKRANAVCGVSQSYVDRALSVNKKCLEGKAVFLGTDLHTFDTNANSEKGIMKNGSELWLAYCGTLGSSYDITCVIDALNILKEQNCEIPEFIVMGDGPKKDEFEEYAFKKKVKCQFLGRLPYDEMCSILKRSDITVNPIMADSAATIINKHGDYAASGLPVINTQNSAEYRALVEEYDMGFNCKNGDAKDMADKIQLLVDNPEIRKQKGLGARRCAEEKFDRGFSYKTLADNILAKGKLICEQKLLIS